MLPTWYHEYKDFIDTLIMKYLDEYFSGKKYSLGGKQCIEAVKYSMKGGKKIRSILALEIYLVLQNKSLPDLMNDMYGEGMGVLPDIARFCIALELVHAYSLVHDDLPCMDNDTLRRGQPTVWKKFGEYQAVLVGDLLNTLAFEILSEIQDAKLSVQLSNLLSKSISFHGMLGGQVDDMYFGSHPEGLSMSDLMNLHNKKTGALIKASVQGGILVSGKIGFLHKLSGFGEKLGLAFQIKDDILDAEGTEAETGKSVGGEQKGFVYFLGLTETKQRLHGLIDECRGMSEVLKSNKIRFLVDYIGQRGK